MWVRVCAEPLRAATERPPAGFLFMDEDEEEEDVYDDDDSQDRLIISERDSDTEIPAQVAMDLTPTELNQQPSVSSFFLCTLLVSDASDCYCKHFICGLSSNEVATSPIFFCNISASRNTCRFSQIIISLSFSLIVLVFIILVCFLFSL